MFSFSHPHILSLRGLCLNPKSGAPYLVMPFMENGDLRKFLRKKADLTDGSSSITTYPHVCLFCQRVIFKKLFTRMFTRYGSLLQGFYSWPSERSIVMIISFY